MAVITENGIVLRTLDEIVSDNTTLWSEKTGDFDVAASSAGGEIIAIKSELDARFDQDIAAAFIDNTIQAAGASLDLVGERKGVYRRENKPTITVVSITGDNGTIIPKGTIFKCSLNDELFETQYQVIVASDVASVTVQSLTFDSVICPSETLSLNSPITGVTTATNLASGIVGFLIESDESYRIRIGQVGTEQTHIKDGLYFALLSLQSVAKARVVDNNTDSTMFSVVPARTFATVVLGGAEEDIVNTIYYFTICGNPTYGDTTNTVLSERGQPYLISYTRAKEQSVSVSISYTNDSTFDSFSGEGQMIQNVIDFIEALKIGETLFIQRLEAVCFLTGVTSVTITLDAASDDIIPTYDTILITNSTLVEVV